MNHIEKSKQSYEKVANEQGKKGIETYGHPLDPLEPGRDWLNMQEQELVDGHQYLVAERTRRDFAINKIKKLTDDPEIDHWLDFMRGE